MANWRIDGMLTGPIDELAKCHNAITPVDYSGTCRPEQARDAAIFAEERGIRGGKAANDTMTLYF